MGERYLQVCGKKFPTGEKVFTGLQEGIPKK
jgi:hypothetical protein